MKLKDKKTRNLKIVKEYKVLLTKNGGFKMDAYEQLGYKYNLNPLHIKRIIDNVTTSIDTSEQE